ncbi:hypothetical protein O0466_000448 [Salmonella enterica]|nr:hypothetical protein [Salmonella enterica]HCM1893435.1 hypothetical protein [Salmonella enterica subsp. diarizonae serovar 57:c:e,n,x,z15]EAX3524699.1 hypothetical protein [Salmonella enterica]EAY1317953.1 hypothetical protein [Salmonella enterica]EGQ5164906.1 hypothetical protein [Salmonella enterica]
MTDILETEWRKTLTSAPKKTISRDEAISLLKEYHVYSTDGLDDAYQRSFDAWQPTDAEIETLRKNLEGVSDAEIQATAKRLLSGDSTQSTDAADRESAIMARINADAEKRRSVLISEGVSTNEVDHRVAFYIAERKRLDGIGI